MSQTEFGSAVGVTRQTQLKYEIGERSPDVAYLVSCRKIGVDVHHVLFGEPDGTVRWVLNADEGFLLKLYRDASADRRAATFGTLTGAIPTREALNQFNGPVGQHIAGGSFGDVTVHMPGGMKVTRSRAKGDGKPSKPPSE